MWILNHRPSGPRALAALIAGCWLLAGVSLSDDILPKGFEVSRYQPLWERNPFTLVTPSLGQGPASPFSKLILVNWLHDKDKDILFVQDTETNEVKKITREAGANSDQLRLLEVVPNKNPSLIVAKLTNGREEGVVKFRFEQQQNGQITAGNITGQRFMPGQVPGPNNQFGNNVPVRRMPQMPPTAVQGQNAQQVNPANAPDAQEIRRRRMLPTPAQNQVPVQQNAVQPQAQVQQNNAQQNNNAGAESDDDE